MYCSISIEEVSLHAHSFRRGGLPDGDQTTAIHLLRLLACPPQRAPPGFHGHGPDAWGSERTREEALAAAYKIAGRPLPEIEGHFAGAWVRVQAGKAPYFIRERRPPPPPPRKPPPEFREGCPFVVLGLSSSATRTEVRRAFHRLALATHPDRGGHAADFVRARRAYLAALSRAV